jgi:TonB-linked SusC/RagA family outer membrane protein
MKEKQPHFKNCAKYLLIMRITLFMIMFGVLSSYAHNNYAQSKQFSINLNNVPLKKVLKTIEKESEFYFMYNDAKLDVKQDVTINVKAKSIYEVLNQLSEQTKISYEIVGKQIVLNPSKNDKKSINQQGFEVQGTVKDEEGNSLPGVNITVKGTTKGVITDINGKYNISLENKSATLVFSFVGYYKKEVSVDGRSQIDVVMEKKMEKLDEVVVIGYGSSSKKLLTSSVASVSSEEIEETVSGGIQEAIQGKTSGVLINKNSGTPGAAISMNIRGTSSISAGTQPLYVVDGIPITTGDYSQVSMEGQGIDAVADINPNNIESISILKDASAASIYGARAGNGVVLIETKEGRKGETRINFKSYYGMQEVYKRLDMMNAEEWKNYVRSFDPEFMSSLYSLTGDTTINTNWQDEVMRLAPISNYELSFSGGNEKTTFFISGRYFNQEGVILGTDYDKINGRLNISHNVTDNFTLGSKVSITHSLNERVRGDQSVNGVLPNAISIPPVYPVYNDDGSYFQGSWWDNPVAIAKEVVNEARTFRTIGNIFGEYDILDNLTFKNQWGIDIYNLNERRFEPSIVQSAEEQNGYGMDATSQVHKVTQQSTLKYLKTLKEKHDFNFLLGYSFEIENRKYNSISKTNFPSDELEYLVAAGKLEDGSSSAYKSAIQSFFSRIKYNYENKYLVSLSVRRDGSSNFGPNNKYATLPAGSFAWRLSEENFLQNTNFISELKWKISYGLTGNDKIGQFGYLSLYSPGYNYMANSGIIPTQIPNKDLKWETTANFNTGINVALFEERIIFNADFYYNKTTDLLLNRPLPGSSGYTSMMANVGELQNKGMEFDLSTENIRKSDFSWSSNFNISFNRNKILKLYNGQPITGEGRGNNAAIEGEPLGVFYMYESLGVDPSTGELVFEDLNNDGDITDADRQVVGDPNPDFTGGFSNNFKYKNFDLSIFLQFIYGQDIFNGVRQYTENMTLGTNDNQLTTIKDRWKKPGDVTPIPKVFGKNNLKISSHYIEDGSFLRISNITLGYNFSNDLLRNFFMDNARVYVKVKNLFTLTPYSGMDPEVNYSGVGSIRSGTDFFTYPQVRTWMAGIKFQF